MGNTEFYICCKLSTKTFWRLYASQKIVGFNTKVVEWNYMVCVTLLVIRKRSRKEDEFERELTACCRAGLKGDRAQAAIDGGT